MLVVTHKSNVKNGEVQSLRMVHYVSGPLILGQIELNDDEEDTIHYSHILTGNYLLLDVDQGRWLKWEEAYGRGI